MAEEAQGIDKLLELQMQLMEKVPHAVRVEVYPKMLVALEVIRSTLLYLSSCGHKPWRPNPLPGEVQERYFSKVVDAAFMLNKRPEVISTWLDERPDEQGMIIHDTRNMVSGLGVIEEVIEYLDTLAGGDRSLQLEEITDIFFFYLEQVQLSGFPWRQIEEQYVRKHAINLERYRKAEEGNYDWDKRDEKEGL